jgi:hypothetical protein
MSRSGYTDDYDDADIAMWRGQVVSAIRGKRGQAFLRDLLAALEALPDKRLIAGHMEKDGCVCATGALGKARGVDMTAIDKLVEAEDDYDSDLVGYAVARAFDIAQPLAREVLFMNDEGSWYWVPESDEQRYERMVKWVKSKIRERPNV